MIPRNVIIAATSLPARSVISSSEFCGTMSSSVVNVNHSFYWFPITVNLMASKYSALAHGVP